MQEIEKSPVSSNTIFSFL